MSKEICGQAAGRQGRSVVLRALLAYAELFHDELLQGAALFGSGEVPFLEGAHDGTFLHDADAPCHAEGLGDVVRHEKAERFAHEGAEHIL